MSRSWLILVAACGAQPTAQPAAKPAPTCIQAADHMLELVEPKDAHARKIRDIFQVRCETDGWPADVRTCIVSTTSLEAPKHCKSRLVIVQRDALERDLSAAEVAARAAHLTDCDRYKQRIEQFTACEKLPQASRDALKQSLDSMRETWENVNAMPEEQQKTMQDACKAGADALEQVMKDSCGL